MSEKKGGNYQVPTVTEHGSVESITEEKNKFSPGTDTDISAINLKGSVGYK